ncbi:putative membrane protein [Streptomyces davaonensis JCM 4913]|uniref:Putative membrane protein n=1 Tax=Streptomyces davaonensis (strain DSM 101723 / JCM 4913 / KCC S-0913 / 768) TaxID=1214101 RepID=K4QY72_STRDJ|nr:hypothetical protein [Streptomyces davaonensis]CCK29011.1 putative membrane protein [Streptomyces davaonensis JCM 4913]
MANQRQAVVIVHGMGEQRPLDALTKFIRAGLPPVSPGTWKFYSKRDVASESFESRRFLAPADGDRPQTEFFEYHWAHLMQGNRMSDMLPTFLKLIRRLPPKGLGFAWLASWVLLLLAGWGILVLDIPFDGEKSAVENLLNIAFTVLGTGTFGVVLLFLATRFGPSFITNSFVDVVRYLDTSPRSYAVRRDIREGMVELLRRLHQAEIGGGPRYQRVIVVAHSLGAYIAYDGITTLWGMTRNALAPGSQSLATLEAAADAMPGREEDRTPTPGETTRYREAQWGLWSDLRAQGNQWRITDFISCGTPMCFAERLYTKNKRDFEARVARRELVTCPPLPQAELGAGDTPFSFSWNGMAVLNDWSPFAVVRWTNLYFPFIPSFCGFLGDWFGGPLGRLFGSGVHDVPVRGNKPWRLIPGWAHSCYFNFPDTRGDDSVTRHLADALDLTAKLPD